MVWSAQMFAGTPSKVSAVTSSVPKTRVAVVFGGRSNEHAISCVSAGSVLAALDPDEFEVIPIGITRDGAWVLTAGDPAALGDHRWPSAGDHRRFG